MNILFVCVANVGRSQMAEALFNKLSWQLSGQLSGQLSRHRATSAGMRVGDRAGQTLADRSQEPEATTTPGNMLLLMKEEEGLDLYANRRTQLTPELVAEADRVFVIAPGEPYPDYLQNSAPTGKVTFWDIDDLFGAPYDAVRQLKEQIKERVRKLVEEIG